ncbi:unnamed protein product [Discula destructiva]
MSNPRTKRQFAGAASDPSQRQITAFFGKPSPGPASVAAPARPVLPVDTESNLLTVGMRVRKSVPEGYKTGSYCALGLFNHDNHHNAPATTPVPARAAHVAPRSGMRELLPFCAINNIGGLAPTLQQPSSTAASSFFVLHHDAAVPNLDDIPSLSSSQSSLATNSSTNTAPSTPGLLSTRKRSYSDDVDGDDDNNMPAVSACLQVPSGEWMDGQVSPRSLVPVGSQWRNTRVMAVPKKRVRKTDCWAETMGQENVPEMMVLDGDGNEKEKGSKEDVDDFPEADFLDYAALEGDAMQL